jgi:hypothetical protein
MDARRTQAEVAPVPMPADLRACLRSLHASAPRDEYFAAAREAIRDYYLAERERAAAREFDVNGAASAASGFARTASTSLRSWSSRRGRSGRHERNPVRAARLAQSIHFLRFAA